MTTRKPRGEQPSNHSAVKPCPEGAEALSEANGEAEGTAMTPVTSLQTILTSCSAPAVHVILQLTKIKNGLAPIGRAPACRRRRRSSPVDSFLHILKTKTVVKNDEHEKYGDTPA